MDDDGGEEFVQSSKVEIFDRHLKRKQVKSFHSFITSKILFKHSFLFSDNCVDRILFVLKIVVFHFLNGSIGDADLGQFTSF